MNNEDYGRYMEAQVADMGPEKKEALITAIKMLFRTFVEDDTQGVLLVLEDSSCMTTMGLNASYGESARLVSLAMGLFLDAEENKNRDTQH